MFELQFFSQNKEPKILCLGSHADDIEIGCGGTILKFVEQVPQAQFLWVTFSGTEERFKELSQSAKCFLKNSNSSSVVTYKFRESFFPFVGAEIKECFEKIRKDFSPDIVFTHCKGDAHQDHRLISDLTWNTFRNNFILEYEIPKYDGDLGQPNLFVHLDASSVNRKIKFILDSYSTQKEKQWFSEETFRSILRLRGIESNSESKYAEAFQCRKIVVGC
jgi:LmbE family N-acetylglucosaminyl deacetylase